MSFERKRMTFHGICLIYRFQSTLLVVAYTLVMVDLNEFVSSNRARAKDHKKWKQCEKKAVQRVRSKPGSQDAKSEHGQ